MSINQAASGILMGNFERSNVMLEQNLFKKARINHSALEMHSSKVAGVVARMLLNGTPFKKARKYIRKNIEEAAKKQIILPKKVSDKLKSRIKTIKKKIFNPRKPDAVSLENKRIKKSGKKAENFTFKMPPESKIVEKYSKLFGTLAKSNHDFIYRPIIHTFHMLRHIFSAAEFHLSYGSQPDQGVASVYRNWRDTNLLAAIEEPNSYLKDAGEYLETNIQKLPNHNFVLSIANQQSEPELMEATRKAARIIQTFFKDYKLPNSYKTINLDDHDPLTKELMGVGGYTGKAIVFDQNTLRVRYSFKELKTLRPVYSHFDEKAWAAGPNNIGMPPEAAMGRKVPSGVESILDSMLDFELILTPTPMSNKSVNNWAIRDKKTEGDFSDSSSPKMLLSYSLQVIPYIKWPREVAYYFTSSEKEEDFIPAFFFRYVALHKQYSGRVNQHTGGFKPPSKIQPLNKIKKLIEQEAKIRKITPRSNKEGFVIVGPSEKSLSGTVIHVPESRADNVEAYTNLYRNAFDKEQNQILFDKNDLMSNKPVLIDWANSMFTYANSVADRDYLKHGVTTINLTGSIPLNDVTIGRDLDRTLYDDNSITVAFRDRLTNFTNEFGIRDTKKELTSSDVPRLVYESGFKSFPTLIEADGVREKFDIDNDEHRELLAADAYDSLDDNIKSTLENLRIYTVVEAFNRLIHNISLDIKWIHIGNPDHPDLKDSPVLRASCAFIKAQCERALSKIDDWGIAYKDKIEFLRYRLWLICRYSKRSEHFIKVYQKEIEVNQGKDIKKDAPVPVYNLPNLKVLLPHTVEAVNCLNAPENKNSFVSIQAGGAKTITSILDITNAIATKKVKRAVVVPPNGLVGTWVDEINSKSEGSINAIPLTTAILRDIERTVSNRHQGANIDTPDYKNLGRYLLSAPPNTIFIASMSFLKSHTETVVYGDKTTSRYYMAEFIRDLFNAPEDLLCCVDESHFVKRIGSARTSAVAVLLTAAKVKRLMSGTMIFDRLTDLVGQTALVNPAALGNENYFDNKYREEKSSLFRPDAQEEILKDLQPFTQNIRHKRRDWAFTLPTLIESFHQCKLTEKQQEYYNSLVTNAIEEIKKDSKLFDELKKDSEKNESMVLAGLDVHLSKIESFIYAPDAHLLIEEFPYLKDDSREAYAFQKAFAKTSGVTKEDLISPKVSKIDSIIDRHINGYVSEDGSKVDPENSKIIVFSYRRVNSAHFYKHTKHQKIAVHYSAGDEAALTRFLNDDRIKVLVADEVSINTGKNFQIAARIIRTETLWVPGGQEQAIARIWRPDFTDLNLKKRPYVYMDWVYTVPSFEALKIARLISKLINMKKYDEGDNPAFMREPLGSLNNPNMEKIIKDLGIYVDKNIPINEQLFALRELKLNLKNLESVRYPQQVKEYFGYYALLNSWEAREFEKAKVDPKNKITVISQQQRKEIPGSKKMRFLPRVPGMMPLDPGNKYSFEPIAVLQEKLKLDAEISNEENMEDDFEGDENELMELLEIHPVKKGDVVDTQWGFGFVVKTTKDTIGVAIPGFKEPILRINKACAYLIGNKDAEKRIRLKLKRKELSHRFPEGMDGSLVLSNSSKMPKFDDDNLDKNIPKFNPSKIVNDINEEDEEIVTRFGKEKVNVTDKNKTIEITPLIVDKQVALMVYEADDDSSFLEVNHGFRRLNDFVAVYIQNVRVLDAVLNKLQASFKIHEKYINNIDSYRSALIKKRLDVFDPHEYAGSLRFLAIEQHKKIKEGVLRPYPIIWNNRLYICFDKESQPSSRKVRMKLSNIPGVKITNEPSSLIHIYKTATQAISSLKEVKEKVKITNYLTVLENLRKAKTLNLRRK